jgi:hypothetical protein
MPDRASGLSRSSSVPKALSGLHRLQFKRLTQGEIELSNYGLPKIT